MGCMVRAWLRRSAFAARLHSGSCLRASSGLRVRSSSTQAAPHLPGMDYQVGRLNVGLIPPLTR